MYGFVTRDILEVGYRLENPPEDAAELEDIVLMDLLKRKWDPLEPEIHESGKPRYHDRKWVMMDGDGN